MLVQAKALNGYKLHGLDGDIGSTKEFYFDDPLLDNTISCREYGKLVDRQEGFDLRRIP